MVDETVDRLKIVGDFKHGSIKTIKLVNFLTYAYVEFNAGPRLNMVCGPNGTGKSSILCAICLGLGGEPRLLGRASEIETFVMNGEDEGQIEIELVDTKGRGNPIITRKIRREKGGNKHPFTWNGKQVSAKHVREQCLKEYDITVDNLCTFLPQDRVGSFSGFDSKQLLIETEKSLSSSQHLYRIHQELIEDQEKLNGGESKVETLRDRIEQLKAETRRFEREKERMREREEAMKQAELLEKKLLWLEFDNCRNEAMKLKELKAEKKAAMRDLALEREPLQQKLDQMSNELRKQEEMYKTLDKEVQKHQKDMQKQAAKYEEHDDKIESFLADLNQLESARTTQQRKVDELRMKVAEVEQKISECNSLKNLEEELRIAQEERKQISPLLQSAKDEERKLSEKLREIQEERKLQEGNWKKLQDEKAQRQANVFRQHPNLKKAYSWIHNNRDKFRKEVFGPVCCEITPKSRNAAAYVEQHVSNNTLKAFVVQTRDDYDLLYKTLRQDMKLPLQLVMVEDVDTVPRRKYSEERMKSLKQDHGVLGFMDESFTAPPVIMAVLRSRHAVHDVLIGSDRTQDSMDKRNLGQFLSNPEDGSGKLQPYCIFTSQGEKSYLYLSSVSKYSKKSNLRIDDVKPAKWLAPGVSETRKQQVKDVLDKCDKDLEEIQPGIDRCRKDLRVYEEQAKSSLDQIKSARANISVLQKFITRQENYVKKLKEEEAKLSINNEEEKRGKIEKLHQRVRGSLEALNTHAESFKKMMLATSKSSGARLNKEVVAVEERKARAQFEEMSRKVEAAYQESERAKEAFNSKRRELQQRKARAEAEAPLVDSNGEPLPLQGQLEELAVEDLEDAKAALEEAQQKIDSIIADPNVVRVYETKKAEMEAAEEELDNLTSSRDKILNEMNTRLTPWQQALESSVSDIDKRFSAYMRELGCTGEVGLTRGTQVDGAEYGNFKEWGIEIRVSFRENVKPQVLSARVQSGGERSVSTIMYLMALQEMMVSPFRCVDEINQGLDDRNERLVFKRIVENSCKPPGPNGPTDHCGQYFLITPKLLPNLVDMEVEAITIQCIFNGPFNLKHPSDWDVPKLIALRNNENTNDASDEEGDLPSQSPSKKRKIDA